jgi:hypothetical protein
MQQQTLVNNIRSSAKKVLDLIEQAQAEAAAMSQEWTKLGGATFLTGFDYTEMDIDADDITNAMSSLSTAMPDILGSHGTNLYTLKD